jgi:hypothetical protein
MPAMSGYVADCVNHLTMYCSQDLMLDGALVEVWAEWHGQWWHAGEGHGSPLLPASRALLAHPPVRPPIAPAFARESDNI